MERIKDFIRKFFDPSMIRFIIVGLINTAVGTAIMFILYNVAHCGYWFSSAANYTLTSILSFFLNKFFTFKKKEWSAMEVVRFAVNIAVCYALAYGLAKPLTVWLLRNAGETLQDNISMLVGMVFFTCFNYIGQRFFAFRDGKQEDRG